MNKTIYFDMDGTIADLYNEPNWLNNLQQERTTPYDNAKAMVDMSLLQTLLLTLKGLGFRIGVISWLSIGASLEYSHAVAQAKERWLGNHLDITFDELHFVPYGTPKHQVATIPSSIIFDDDERVRNQWTGIAIDPQKININDYLLDLLASC